MDDPNVTRAAEIFAATSLEDESYPSAAAETAALLDSLAAKLRDPAQREPLGKGSLPSLVSKIIGTPLQDVKEGINSHLALVAQAARVAANLVADCDVNRDRLADESYPSHALALLRSKVVDPLPIDTLRPLVVSLLNLTPERHAASVSQLGASIPDLLDLCDLAGQLYTPGKWNDDGMSVIASWLWAIVANVIPEGEEEKPTFNLRIVDVAVFLPPLLAVAPRGPPANPDVDAEAAFNTDMSILTNATHILERFGTNDKIDHSVLEDAGVVKPLLDFVEDAIVPPWLDVSTWGNDEDEDEDEGEQNTGNKDIAKELEKTVGVAKARVARSLVALMAETKLPAWLWERIDAWLDMPDRPDLVSCALLTYGNHARSDAAAEELLTESLTSRLVSLLQPKTLIVVQHALVGLLRNLSIPPVNKQKLGEAGVIDALVGMEPWDSSRDAIGSVQGGAVGVVKNLVREAENAAQFLNNTAGVEALHALIARTDDPAIAAEGTRVWVNAVRSIAADRSRTGLEGGATSHPEEYDTAWARLSDERVIIALTRLLTASHTVLVNEGIIALALLAAFGQCRSDIEALLQSQPAQQPEAEQDAEQTPAAPETGVVPGSGADKSDAKPIPRGVDVLASLIAPLPGSKTGPEVQANALTLVRAVGGGVRDTVAAAVADAKKHGRPVATGADKL